MSCPLTAAQATAVFDVLVQHAGAREDMREEFLIVETSQVCHEFRFQGSLGFGGKFWRTTGLRREDPDLKWAVAAYPESVTRDPRIQDRIDTTNRALTALAEQGVTA